MFRHAIATSSRALRAAPKVAVPRPFIQSQFQAAPAFTFRSAQPAVSRWYSDAKESEAKPTEEAKSETKSEEKPAEGENAEVAQLKKDLQARDVEVKDWKVCGDRKASNCFDNTDYLVGQVPAHCRRLPQPSRAHYS